MAPLPSDIDVNGLNSIRMEEGRALRAYQDSVGVWTVGYGLTNMDRGLPWKVQRGLVITAAEAEWHLYQSIRANYLPDVLHALDLSKCSHPQGALNGGCGFHFNTGGIKRASWPKLLTSGNLAAAEANLKSWCRAGGKVLSDLVNRRAHEWLIITQENYGHLSGPTIVEPSASGHETYKGHAELLTALPSPPGHISAPKTAPTTVAPTAGPVAGLLHPGDKGDKVTDLQHKLGAAGLPVPVTGVFDDATEKAVRAFQAIHPNLTEDGNVGPATDAALVRAAQVKDIVIKTGKTVAPATGGLYVAFHQWWSAHAADVLLYGAIAGVAVFAVYLAYHYRYDIVAKVNKLLGRTTP